MTPDKKQRTERAAGEEHARDHKTGGENERQQQQQDSEAEISRRVSRWRHLVEPDRSRHPERPG